MSNEFIARKGLIVSGNTNISNDVYVHGNITIDGTIYGTVEGDTTYDIVFLTYSGTSGTTSGTMGCTLTSPGNWTVTNYNTIYHVDDTNGNIIITIPDADGVNLGKTMIFVKPRTTISSNNIKIITVSGQYLGNYAYQYLYSSNDRIELIAHRYGTLGINQYRYRSILNSISVKEELNISQDGNQLFSDIKSAIDYCNSYADGPRRIKINPGNYNINDTIEINCPYPLSLEGFGTSVTNLYATTSLSTKPMFDVKSTADFTGLAFYGLSGKTSIDDECCIDCSTSNLYTEVHQCYFNGFYKAIEIEGDTEFWIFDSIIENSRYGIWTKGGKFGTSEMTIKDNTVGVQIELSATTNNASIQNTIFDVKSGQVGINYIDNNYAPTYHFATNNAFYGGGTYLSGFTFTTKAQSDVRYENNVGLANYRPESWMWISGNTNATVIGSPNVFYPVVVGGLVTTDFIKFSGTSTSTSTIYLPSINRKGMFNISGDISCATNNQVLGVALYQNGQQKQKINVRTSTGGIAVPFSFAAINNMAYNNIFEIRVTNAATNNVIVNNLYFSITTI